MVNLSDGFWVGKTWSKLIWTLITLLSCYVQIDDMWSVIKDERNSCLLKVYFRVAYLWHLWEETDGERQSQSEGGKDDQAVDRQDEPPMSLQERKPGGTQTRRDAVNLLILQLRHRYVSWCRHWRCFFYHFFVRLVRKPRQLISEKWTMLCGWRSEGTLCLESKDQIQELSRHNPFKSA